MIAVALAAVSMIVPATAGDLTREQTLNGIRVSAATAIVVAEIVARSELEAVAS